jgi:cytochrome c-type biogenesis protein CcmH
VSVLRSFRLWAVALVAVAGLALVVGPGASGDAARVAHLETLVRCPSCEDLSVAQSDATSAVAVRHDIARAVARGQSDSQILTSLEATYGPTILLSPPTTGLGVLLWVVPVLAVLVLVGVVIRLARRRDPPVESGLEVPS